MNGALSCSRPPQALPRPRSCSISLINTLSSKQRFLLPPMCVYPHVFKFESASNILQSHLARMTLCFHLPFCLLRDHPCADSRQDREGRLRRKSLALPSMQLPCTSQPSLGGWICDSQVSALVSVVDVGGWTAYMFEDTYYKAREPSQDLDVFCSEPSFYFPDALTAGTIDSTRYLGPREYFLRVFHIRIEQAFQEWQVVVDRLEEIVQW